MANVGNLGTSPYSKVVLDNAAVAATDTPVPISFVGEPQTGLAHPAANTVAIACNGTEAGKFTATVFTIPGYFAETSIATNLTAPSGSIAGALGLSSAFNFVGNAPANGGVILPLVATVGIGSTVVVFNDGANAIKVYGSGSDTVDGAAAATGVTLTNAKRCMYFAKAAATWISAQLGVVSA